MGNSFGPMQPLSRSAPVCRRRGIVVTTVTTRVSRGSRAYLAGLSSSSSGLSFCRLDLGAGLQPSRLRSRSRFEFLLYSLVLSYAFGIMKSQRMLVAYVIKVICFDT